MENYSLSARSDSMSREPNDDAWLACDLLLTECREFQTENSARSPRGLLVLQLKFTGIWVRVDLLVEESVIVDIKAVEQLTDVHRAQVLTYLRLAKVEVGLLINFNAAILHRGIKRFALAVRANAT